MRLFFLSWLLAGVLAQPAALADQGAALLPDQRADVPADLDRYTIVAQLDLAANTLTGTQELAFVNQIRDGLDHIYLALYPNLPDIGGRTEVTAVQVDGRDAALIYEQRRYALRVALPAPLALGATADVTMRFTTRVPVDAARRAYGAFNREPMQINLATAYPILAPLRDGTWLSTAPSPKGDFVTSATALYDVTLDAPADWALATTGTQVETRSADGRQITRFVSGPQREFAIVASRHQSASVEVGGTRITSYFRAEHAAGGQLALQVAADALRVFNTQFGQYPFTELDVVEIGARKFYGVEYPGLIMIDAGLYTGKNGELTRTVAHEVGHQWWYGLVGNDTQREPWLDEGPTTYMQVVYFEGIGQPEAAARELAQFRADYRRIQGTAADRPLRRSVLGLGRSYYTVAYAKGALFLQAVREQVGDAAFYEGLRSYYRANRFGTGTTDELLTSFAQSCGCSIAKLAANWVG